MDKIRDFLDNLLMELVIFLIGYSIGFLKRKIEKQQYKKIVKYSFNKESSRLTFITANSNVFDNQELVTLGYTFEYLSVGTLTNTLKKLYSNVLISTVMSETDYSAIPKKLLRSNLFVIGGPFHNQVTKRIMDCYENIPFRFDNMANLFFTDEDGLVHIYKPEVFNNNKSNYFEKDYALIINIVNPWDKDKRIILIIGCRSVGCYGGAVYFCEKIREIRKTIKDDEYAIIISCHGEEENLTSTPKFEAYFKIDTAKLDIDKETENIN